MLRFLTIMVVCVAVVPLPPKRGDGSKVRYVPVVGDHGSTDSNKRN